MASSAVEQVVKDELRHYPGVDLELKNGGKHDRAVFHLGGKSRFMVLPKTPSDHRAPKNVATTLRKTMEELGAHRQPLPRPTTRGDIPKGATAGIALNSSYLSLIIPRDSKLLSRFKTPDGKPKGHWVFEIQSSVTLADPPLIAIKRTTLPPGMQKKPGVVAGWGHNNGGWLLNISRGMVPVLTRMVDRFPTTEVQVVRDTADELVFKLPRGTIPTSYQPHHDVIETPEPEREQPAPKPSVAWADPKPPEPEVAPAPAPSQPGVLEFKWPKQSVSIEQAINVLNAKKRQHGNNLRFTIEEGGYISAVHRIGK
jgi:hypothetical protein